MQGISVLYYANAPMLRSLEQFVRLCGQHSNTFCQGFNADGKTTQK